MANIKKIIPEQQNSCGQGNENFLIDLTTKIDALILKNPLIAAAGSCGYGIHEAMPGGYAAVCTNSITLLQNSGAPQPRVFEAPASVIHNTGNVNHGLNYFCEKILPQAAKKDLLLIPNICADSINDFAKIAAALEEKKVQALELNLSAINPISNQPFDAAVNDIAAVVKAVRAAFSGTLLVKLTPYGYDISEAAIAAAKEGANALTLINPLPAMAVNAYSLGSMLGSEYGYLSGPPLKAIALRAVHQAALAVDIPIIGCGGITNGFDVLEFITAGASAVQIGTANWINPNIAEEVTSLLNTYMQQQYFSTMKQFYKAVRGKFALR